MLPKIRTRYLVLLTLPTRTQSGQYPHLPDRAPALRLLSAAEGGEEPEMENDDP